MQELLTLCKAFGLSSAAGLNAYIPLLTISIMANRGLIQLRPPYDTLGSGWCVALLAVLLLVELVVDKVPGADHLNDLVHTAIRPIAGAILFASQMGILHSAHPAVWIVLGLLCAGSVHATKALARPALNLGSAGFAAPVASALENLVSITLTVVAVLAPLLTILLAAVFGWVLFRLWQRFRHPRPSTARAPIPVPAVAVEPLVDSAWKGGV